MKRGVVEEAGMAGEEQETRPKSTNPDVDCQKHSEAFYRENTPKR